MTARNVIDEADAQIIAAIGVLLLTGAVLFFAVAIVLGLAWRLFTTTGGI